MLPAEFQKKMRSKNKTLHPGRTAIGFDHDNQLHAYFENLRQQGRAVSVWLLCAEYKRLRADNVELPNKIVQQQIYRWMRRKRVTNQHVTHQAQNTPYNEGLMKDWVQYLEGQIEMLGIPEENIANFDETNIDFSIDSKTTLDTLGSWSINV
jgi:hypothetical protein